MDDRINFKRSSSTEGTLRRFWQRVEIGEGLLSGDVEIDPLARDAFVVSFGTFTSAVDRFVHGGGENVPVVIAEEEEEFARFAKALADRKAWDRSKKSAAYVDLVAARKRDCLTNNGVSKYSGGVENGWWLKLQQDEPTARRR